MEQDFIDILKQLVAEQVNAVLSDKKQFKSILADYTRNQYQKESRWLIQAVEAGVAKAIKEADDLPACKRGKINELVEDYGLSPEVSAAIVDTLALVLRGDTSKSVTVTPTTPVVEKAAASQPVPKQEIASNKAVEKPAASQTPVKGKINIHHGIYEGDIVNGKPHGKGKGTLLIGEVYEGDWVDGKKTGKGKTFWPNEPNGLPVYEGDFLNDHWHGKGKLTWTDGSVYEGDWDISKNGKGKKTWPNGNVYEGDWVNDKFTGKGKYTWADGSVYEGDWVNDKRTGKGKYTWPDGTVYEGDFVNGQCTGKGKKTWPNGTVYEGDWVNDIRTGKGKLTWANGDVQEGRFENDKFIGK